MTGTLNYSDFRVISPELISFSTATIRVNMTSLAFNMAAAAELGYPENICLLATEDGSKVGLQVNPPPQFADATVPFFDRTISHRGAYAVTVRDPAFVKALRRTVGWGDKKARRANGVLYRKLGLLLFDLDKAITSSGVITGNANISDYPRYNEVMGMMRPAPLLLAAPNFNNY